MRAAERGLSDLPYQRCALVVLGQVRARRGEPGGAELLREAEELAVELRELRDRTDRRGPGRGGLAGR